MSWELRITPWNKSNATIWETIDGYTWHTWDEHGTGGQNSVADSLVTAKRRAYEACLVQGFI